MQKCDIFELADEIAAITDEIKTMSGKFRRDVNQEVIFIQVNAAAFISNKILPFSMQGETDVLVEKSPKKGLPSAIQSQCSLIVENLGKLREYWIRKKFVVKNEDGIYDYPDNACFYASQETMSVLYVLRDLVSSVRYNAVLNLDNKSAYSFFGKRADEMEQTIKELK